MKTIGILGGMGPEATLDMYKYIIEHTPAQRDQDHIPVLIYSIPQVPDRTESILNNNHTEIINYLTTSAKVLEKGNADFIIIPCNTAHYYIDYIRKAVNIPVLNMIEETRDYVLNRYDSISEIGLLATTGTHKTELYQNVFKSEGIEVVIPEDDVQNNLVMESVYSVKAKRNLTKAKALMRKAVDYFQNKNIKIIIMGCTEVPLVLNQKTCPLDLINPSVVIALKAIHYSIGERYNI